MPFDKIKVDILARVEGEGALNIEMDGRNVRTLELRIFEPPRFFQGILVGREMREVPDITARICGICPVAYQMSSLHALEAALGVTVHPSVRALRRLFYLAEWIESHTLHIYLLSAPDFLGYESGIALAQDHPDVIKRGLRLKKLGNRLMALIGGREVHPISATVGGFYKRFLPADLTPMLEELAWAKEAALDTVAWVAGFAWPDFEGPSIFMAVSHPKEYGLIEGDIITSSGLSFPPSRFKEFVVETQVPYSNALHAELAAQGPYMVGPLARVNLNFDRLSPDAQAAARNSGVAFPTRNTFAGIVARAVEVVHAVDEITAIIRSYEPPEEPLVAVTPAAGTGAAATEAPRGLLWHQYTLDPQGIVLAADIVPPTSQNQRQIEQDLLSYLPRILDQSEDQATLECERIIRSYDPCISCATHFLKMRVAR